MNYKILLAALLFFLTGISFADAQTSLNRGAQVTSEGNVVSGKPYLLYYVGNNNSCYVKASAELNHFKVEYNDLSITDEAVFCFFDEGSSKWKIQSWKTGKYFPVPTKIETNFIPTEAASAGSWTLNFLSGGNIAPYSYNSTANATYSLNRSQISDVYYLHGWDQGTQGANQLRIYEIAISTTANSEFADKEVNVSGTAAASLITGQWYVMKSGDNYFIDSASGSTTTTVVPRGFATANAKYLVRLTDAGDSNYYVETGYGNYLFTGNTTTRVSATKYSISDLSGWTFYPVTLADPLRPTASEVYTINGSGSWMFSPTGFGTYQYYLYNLDAVDEKKFAYPTGNYSTSAVPVILESQGDGTYQILTKDGVTKVVSATAMTIAKSGAATTEQTTALNNALGTLLAGQTKVTTPASQITTITSPAGNVHADGWYALRIHSDSNDPLRDGNYLYTLETENQAFGRPHPMSQGGSTYQAHPTADDAIFYVRLWPVTRDNGTYYHWQVPSGKYVVNHLNDYPITWNHDASDFVLGDNGESTDKTYYIQSSGYRTQICKDDSNNDYLGKTTHSYTASATKLDIYKVDVAGQGLTPWKVVFNEGADDIKLHCTRSDVHGLTDVYNNGFFFLPTGQTPVSSEFTLTGMSGTPVINTDAKTIRVKYAPTECLITDNITVVQGARTTGVGNTMQALLRMEVKPHAPCNPKSFKVNLAGASNFTLIQAYLTTADQLRADNDTPDLLGTTAIRDTGEKDGEYTIDVTTPANHLLKMNETYYIWITADIVNDATAESEVVDASISSFTYQNAADSPVATELNISDKGDPDGNMRVFMKQSYVWVSSEKNADDSHYYRNPAILSLGSGNDVVAFSEYRYDNVNALGKDYDGSDYGHRIDVVMKKSSDNGATWGDAVVVAAGAEATEGSQASGYSNPAVALVGSKLICLMSQGADAYDSSNGLQHIAISTSIDGGANWTAPADIWSTIDWNGVAHHSAYVTPGKGLVYGTGPTTIAFVLNVKSSASSATKEYRLYSTDGGDSWTVDATPLSGKGMESKLEMKNDGSLYVTGKKPASKDCNNDVLYFSRGEGESANALLQTIMWKKDGDPERLRDLRLYASFDQAATWQQLFVIHPDNAGVSSMQKLSDGNLAIFFEDGSIGNNEKDGCYALNYVVIDAAMVRAQTDDLLTSIIIQTTPASNSAPFVNGSGWAKSVTTNNNSGFAGVVISATYGAFNRESKNNRRYFDLRPNEANLSATITITAPEGYVVKGYKIDGISRNGSGTETYTLTAAAGTGTTTATLGTTSGGLNVDGIYTPSTTFTLANSGTFSNTQNYALISDFWVVLAKDTYGVKLNQVNPGGKSYATLYTDFDLRQIDETTKAYYIAQVANGKAELTETPNDGRDIPKETAVVLINSEGNTFTEFTIVSSSASVEGNLLVGTLTGETLDLATNKNWYVFGRRRVRADESSAWGDYVAGFYNNGQSSFALGANRAYLIGPSAESRGFDIIFGDDDEGTLTPVVDLRKEMPCETGDTTWYTLDGRKVSATPKTKGIYVRNGQKMVIK